MSELLPDGIDDLRDAPHHIFNAIRRALVFLSFAELPEEERPKRRIWLDDEKLNAFFADLKRKRAEKADGKEIEDPVQNDAVAMLVTE